MTELKGNYQVAFDMPVADLMKLAQSASFAMPGDSETNPANAAADPSGTNVIFNNVPEAWPEAGTA